MKILVISNDSGGLYAFRKELLSALCAAHEVIVATPFDASLDGLSALGCRLIETKMERRGMNPAKDLVLLQTYQRIMRDERPDLVITYTIKPNIYGGLAAQTLKIPYAANITGLGTAFQKQGGVRRMIETMYRSALRKAKVVFFENTGNRDTLVDLKIVKPEQCRCLNGAGVNLDHFQLTEYPAEQMHTRFLFIGRIMREKGADELFWAMRQLRKEGVLCSLDVVGSFEENYKAQLDEYQKENLLRYHGFQKDVRPFIANAHCFVLPSWHEGMANTLLESAAMGRPLITSDIHGCMEAVNAEKSGYLFPVKDREQLLQTMIRFCLLPYEQKRSMGEASHRHVALHFDKRNVVSDTIRYLFE